jgi:hypothetical protein
MSSQAKREDDAHELKGDLLSAKEISASLCVPLSTVYAWLRSGFLRSEQTGKCRYGVHPIELKRMQKRIRTVGRGHIELHPIELERVQKASSSYNIKKTGVNSIPATAFIPLGPGKTYLPVVLRLTKNPQKNGPNTNKELFRQYECVVIDCETLVKAFSQALSLNINLIWADSSFVGEEFSDLANFCLKQNSALKVVIECANEGDYQFDAKDMPQTPVFFVRTCSNDLEAKTIIGDAGICLKRKAINQL